MDGKYLRHGCSNISVDIGLSSDPLPEYIASIYFSLSSGGIFELSSDSSLLYALLQDSDDKFTSSNCTNLIILPVCSLEYVAQGVYVTERRIAIASE